MTMSPRAATVLVISESATVFTLEREDFQHFLVSSGLRANYSSAVNESAPEAPDFPLDYMIIPKAPPFHPNCVVLLPQPELSRAPTSSTSGAVQRPRSTTTSAALAPFRGLLLQPWPDALNDSEVDVLGAPAPSLLTPVCTLTSSSQVFLRSSSSLTFVICRSPRH
jgi:hypothetical protein